MSIVLFKVLNYLFKRLELIFILIYNRIRKENGMAKKTTVGKRLKYIMEQRNLRQVDLINKVNLLCERKGYDVHISKSDLSQYLSGKTEPGADKSFVIAEALDVNPAWLAGYNAPMASQFGTGIVDIMGDDVVLDSSERLLIELYRKLNETGRQKVISYTEDLVSLGKYTDD